MWASKRAVVKESSCLDSSCKIGIQFLPAVIHPYCLSFFSFLFSIFFVSIWEIAIKVLN